jgi:hypothetical protein
MERGMQLKVVTEGELGECELESMTKREEERGSGLQGEIV